MDVQPVLTGILLLLGVGFLVANVRILVDLLTYQRRRRAGELLTWPSRKPANYAFMLALGAALGLLFIVKVAILHRPAFGEAMMCLYYGGMVPLSRRIGRGFYADGIWADSSFIPYHEVGGISWREGEHEVTLVVISRLKHLARRLVVPGDKYGAARRILRDKISGREIHFSGTGLDLGSHDERDHA
jgi:hypothetical protein